MTTGVRWRMICLAVLLTLIIPSDCAFGAISIDFGSQFLKVGLIKPGVPMEIVLNKESHRKTPNVVSIRQNERLFGDAASAMSVRYPSSVYGHLLDLVAKHIDHPSVLLFRQRFPHLAIEKHANESSVIFPIGDTSYPVETLLAMILTNVREFTEAYAEMSLRDVVISVPVFFTQAERLVIEKAAEIAKLNLLQLINDGTAAGLNYGVFRRKEVTEKPQRLLIYDMGAAKTVATLVEYKLGTEKYGKEPKMSVLGVGFDRYLGGLEMTMRLRDLLVEKFRQHYKSAEDITTSQRAMAKLFKEAERLKQVLSANVDYYAQVESVHEDIDMRVHVTREEFNHLIDDLMPRVTVPLTQALKMAELQLDQVDQVVLMGAGTRVPRVQEEVQKFIGSKELGRFLNTDEAIAMGALYQAAHLSKGFKVKPFGVEELVVFPVQVNFASKQKQENGEFIEKPFTRQLFPFKAYYPTVRKTITFTSYTDDFSFDLNYADLKHFTDDQIREFDSLVSHLTTVSVLGLGKALEGKLNPEQTEFTGVKVGFLMDMSGVLRVEKAEAVLQRKSQGVVESITNTITGFFSKKTEEGETTESEDKSNDNGAESVTTDEKPPPTEEKPAEDSLENKGEQSKDGGENKSSSEEPADKEEKKEAADAGEGKNDTKEKAKPFTSADLGKKNDTSDVSAEKKKVPQIERVALKVKEKYTTSHMMGEEDVASAKKILEQFEKRERHARERAAAENELEGYAFEERNKLLQESKRIRTWLEEEVVPETKTGDFTKNHAALVAMVRPIKKRIDEGKTLPQALANLESMLNSSRVMASMGGDDEKSLFNKTDSDAFTKKLEKLTSWLQEKKAEQEGKQPYEEPAVLTSEVVAKLKSLDRELSSFMKKMRQAKLKDLEDRMKNDSKTESGKKDSTEGPATAEGEDTMKATDSDKDSQTGEQSDNDIEKGTTVENETAKETGDIEGNSHEAVGSAKDTDTKTDKVEL
nr:Heat shock protein 70 domain containing protein [Haemonchus contortus]